MFRKELWTGTRELSTPPAVGALLALTGIPVDQPT
jgi:hypothetical protein